MSNHGELCRDGIFGNLQIKGKVVLDSERNLFVKDTKVRGNAQVNQDLVVCGDLNVKGCISQLGEEYDVIIVGAGAAGATAAKTISDAGISVLLLEKGANENDNPVKSFPFNPDTTNGFQLNLLRGIFGGTELDHIITSDIKGNVAGAVMTKKPSGSGLGWGGSTNHNFAVAVHTTDQYDDHFATAYGGPEWTSTVTRPLKKEIETFDQVFGGPAAPSRGTDGPIRVTKFPDYSLAAGANALGNIFDCLITESTADTSVTTPIVSDYNASGETTVLNSQIQNTVIFPTFQRSHAGNGYLGPTIVDQTTGEGVSGRPLKVVSHATVNRVKFDDNKKACGVEAVINGKTTYFAAKYKVIVCAGGLRTPGLLERSGLGDATLLTSLDIPVVCDIPAVGEHVKTHMGPMTLHTVNQPAYDDLAALGFPAGGGVGGFLKVNSTSPYPLDRRLQINPAAFGGFGYGVYNPDDQLLKSLDIEGESGNIILNTNFNLQPTSEGSIHIVNKDPSSMPYFLRCLNDTQEDNDFELDVLRLHKAVADCMTSNYPADGYKLLFPPESVNFNDDEELRGWAKAAHVVTDHWSGSCRMGLVPTGNVVAGNLHVYGVKDLMVADNSIFPIVPDGNTSFPCMVVGKQAARFVVDELSP